MTDMPPFSLRAQDKEFVVFRGESALTSPLKFPLAVPTKALGDAVIAEFAAQGSKMDARKMPMTQMALTALDVSSPQRAAVIEGLMRFGETELVCQRATDPADLVAEQNRVWQPYLDWCKARLNADLLTGCGIIPFDQSPGALSALRAFVETLDAYFLTGLGQACGTLGSLVLGLALLEKKASVQEAFEAAELDHLWQVKKWGIDPAVQDRHAEITRDLETCAAWFELLRA